MNTPSRHRVRSAPPAYASRSASPRNPKLCRSGSAPAAPSLATVIRTSSPSRLMSIVHQAARLCRNTLVLASRSTGTSWPAASAGSGAAGWVTVQRTPDERSTCSTAATWSRRSTER